MSRKVSFFIDGFNVYHFLKPYDHKSRRYITKYVKYLWLDFMKLANRFTQKYDKAIIITTDTDLIPAIQVAKSCFPNKGFGVLFPIGRWSSELSKACDFWLKISKKDLNACQFPEKVHLPSGVTLTRPETWK